jgi:hypothetical protein
MGILAGFSIISSLPVIAIAFFARGSSRAQATALHAIEG